MGNQVLHRLTIPEDSVTDAGSRTRRNLAEQNSLTIGQSSILSLSTEPKDRLLIGQYRAKYAKKLAEELEGLFAAKQIDAVVFYDDDSSQRDDGYYEMENVSSGPVNRPQQNVENFDGVIRRIGSRKSHFRAVRTSTSSQADHSFGSQGTGYVGVDANTAKIWWLNDDGSREEPTLVTTNTTEFGDVELYDSEASSYENPTLIYELDYSREGRTDAKVWDDRGNGLSGKKDADSIVQWQRVFGPEYDFKGEPIIENGRLRLLFDEANGTITAEEYTSGSWSSISLTPASWEVVDLDLYYVGRSRLDGQVVFNDTDDGSKYHLDVSLKRGWQNALWHVPQNESSTIPPELETWLTPIASSQIFDPRERVDLVDRKEFRK